MFITITVDLCWENGLTDRLCVLRVCVLSVAIRGAFLPRENSVFNV